MPSTKTRINLTVGDDLNDLLVQLSSLEGVPKATLVVNILEELRPHLTDLVDAIQLVKDKKDASKSINKLLVKQQKQFLNALEVDND